MFRKEMAPGYALYILKSMYLVSSRMGHLYCRCNPRTKKPQR